MQFSGRPCGGGGDGEVSRTGGMTVGMRVGDSADSQSQVQALMFRVQVSITSWSSSCRSSSWATSPSWTAASSSWRTHREEFISWVCSQRQKINKSQFKLLLGGLLMGSYLLGVNGDQRCTTSIDAWNVEADGEIKRGKLKPNFTQQTMEEID